LEELHLASLHVKYWRLKCVAKANSYDASTTLAAILPLLPAHSAIVDDGRRTDKQYLNAAKRQLVRVRRDASSKRKAFLQALKERIAMRKTSSTLSAAAALQCINKQLGQPGHIKYVLRPSTQTPLTKVHLTSTDQRTDPLTGVVSSHKTVSIINTKAKLESRILARNKKHFAQAENTPFTESPLKSMHVGEDLNKYFDLDGTPLHLPDGTFPETVTVLQLIREAFHERPPPIDPVVSFEALVTSLLHWDEKTSTSPSGRHLGLYKSLVTAHIDSGNEFGHQPGNDDDTPTVQEHATEVLYAIYAAAVSVAQRGLYLDRWIHVVNAMIYKKPGVLELDELCVIQLL
jgi:hypothetical protein